MITVQFKKGMNEKDVHDYLKSRQESVKKDYDKVYELAVMDQILTVINNNPLEEAQRIFTTEKRNLLDKLNKILHSKNLPFFERFTEKKRSKEEYIKEINDILTQNGTFKERKEEDKSVFERISKKTNMLEEEEIDKEAFDEVFGDDETVYEAVRETLYDEAIEENTTVYEEEQPAPIITPLERLEQLVIKMDSENPTIKEIKSQIVFLKQTPERKEEEQAKLDEKINQLIEKIEGYIQNNNQAKTKWKRFVF